MFRKRFRGFCSVIKTFKDIVAILGMDELSEDDKQTVNRARRITRFLSQPFHVAEKFTLIPGRYVSIDGDLGVRKKLIWSARKRIGNLPKKR